MFDVEITGIVMLPDHELRKWSTSVAESGPTAGADSWRAALRDGATFFTGLMPENYAELHRYFDEFGADFERDGPLSEADLRALLLQYIAGHVRTDRACPSEWGAWTDDDGRTWYTVSEV